MSRPTLSWERVRGRVTLRDLHILAAVVQWGSMARGAAHLGLSQPSVSEAVAKLEAALRVRLLDRSPRGVEPTLYGRTLLRRANVVFDELSLSRASGTSSSCPTPERERSESAARNPYPPALSRR